MNSFSIKTKLNIIVLATVVIVSIILATQSILTINSVSEQNIQKYKTEAYKTKEAELENYVSVAMKTVESYYKRTEPAKIKEEVSKQLKQRVNEIFSIIEYQYKTNKGKISDTKLKKQIKDIVSSSRYGTSGYYWINDLDAVIIDHPIKPQLNGKDLSNFKDKDGTQLFQEFADVCKANGDGFVDYVWPKPGFEKPQPKVSYVKLFKPFNWVIGTGAYVDDVTTQMKNDALKTISEMRYGKSGYFWINDMQPKMIMHPMKPSLDGKDLSAVKDPNGVYLFNEMVKVSKENGGGLVKYAWPKPGKDKPQLKFSYVKLFDKWNWVVGTGAYVDDIEDKIVAMQKQTSEKVTSTIISFVISSLIIIAILISIVTVLINNSIIKPLKNFEVGIDSFFKYLRRETNHIENLDDTKNDELGQMAKIVNKSINDSKQDIQNNHLFIDDVQKVMNKVEKGCFSTHIQKDTNDPHLQQLKLTINNGLIHLKEKFVQMNSILQEYSNHNYTNELKITGVEKDGAFDKLTQNVNNLRASINEMLVENKSNGLTLEQSSEVLLANVKTLNQNSNSAAASLEETAAALEQITSNISQNTENIVQMASHANEVTKSVNNGEKLATQTTSSMDEINNEVTAINEAISVIDQISFQTNILSLNAAVEAATAGEAGKGFAVVAGEVRNLASRSAEAANEIKTLVENATSKANSGKKISDEMIEGYHILNDSISKTLELIQSVENASKEQLRGIEQINNAVNELDQQTQDNASIASQTNSVASKTDSIAKIILKSADEKEFIGKDQVTTKV